MLGKAMKSHALVIEDGQAILEVCLNLTIPSMKRLLLFALLMIGHWAIAQQITDEDREKLNPYHYQTKVMLSAIPGYIEMGGFNFTYGYGLNADAFIGKYLSFNAGMTTAGYGDHQQSKGKDPFQSDSYQSMKLTSTSQFAVNLHFFDKITMGRIRKDKLKGWSTSNNMDGGQTTTYYYDVFKKRGPVRRIMALRAGLYNWNTVVAPESNEKWFMNKTGTTTPVAVTDRMYTNLNTSDISVGLAFGKFVANSDLARGGVVSYFRNLYVDVLLNTSVSLDNNKDKTGASYVYQWGNGDLTKASMGWKVGWKWMGLGRKYWTGGYYMEFGSRPGLGARGPFLQIGLLLGTKYPFKPMQ